jgi:hypothetical protein
MEVKAHIDPCFTLVSGCLTAYKIIHDGLIDLL